VSKYAAEAGILQDLTLSVESGGTGGLPAGGLEFGAMIGADAICDMSMQFDFYDGGGLDCCFMGALEMDRLGNVNAHRGLDQASGIGGFGNITAATKNVIFCLTTSTKGLNVTEEDGRVRILEEGAVAKLVDRVRSISFSGPRAIQNGQRVLYVTERCVFTLRPAGLTLLEVYPGVDKQRDILDRLPFPVLDETEG
jgi:propionate CoA-transferase